jgi:hypothetical protein
MWWDLRVLRQASAAAKKAGGKALVLDVTKHGFFKVRFARRGEQTSDGVLWRCQRWCSAAWPESLTTNSPLKASCHILLSQYM